MNSNLANKISRASRWLNLDSLSDSKDTDASTNDNTYNTSVANDTSSAYASASNTLSDIAWSWDNTSIKSNGYTWIDNSIRPNSILGSGPASWSWSGTTVDNIDTPENKTDDILKDLKIEIEDKIEECDKRIDDIFNQMKENRSKTTLMGPVFQYHVGMRLAYETVLSKIKKYLKDNKNGNEEN